MEGLVNHDGRWIPYLIKCCRTTLNTLLCGFMTLHLRVQTKHANFYDFSFLHITMELQYFTWNQTELHIVWNCWNFTNLFISLISTIKNGCILLDKVRKFTSNYLGEEEEEGEQEGWNALNYIHKGGHIPTATIKKRSTCKFYSLQRYIYFKKITCCDKILIFQLQSNRIPVNLDS